MINRSLIRIKTVQILYSYLLTRRDFWLEAAPVVGESTRDQQIAYSVYLDMLVLLLKMSGCAFRNTESGGKVFDIPVALTKNKVGKMLGEDSALIELLAKNPDRLAVWDPYIPEILHNIETSAVYKQIASRRKADFGEDVKFWVTVFNTIIRKSRIVERVLRRSENFSHMGFEHGIDMLSKTLTGFDDSRSTYRNARKALDDSLTMAYNLYIGLLHLPVDITDLRERQLDEAKHKYLPTYDDLNPNMRFVDNLLVDALRKNEQINQYLDENPKANPMNWRDSDIMVSRLLNLIMASEAYAKYMETPEGDPVVDGEFWREIMRSVVLPSDELAESLESTSLYWNDDLHIMSTFDLKTLRRFYAAPEGSEGDESSKTQLEIMPKFMNAQDERFGSELFEYVVDNRETYRSYIDRFIDSKQWDSERLAFMDIVIMMTALAEIINFPSIPAAVTLNEYIEIANDYSTPKSGQFINGILSSVIHMLNEDGVIHKQL